MSIQGGGWKCTREPDRIEVFRANSRGWRMVAVYDLLRGPICQRCGAVDVESNVITCSNCREFDSLDGTFAVGKYYLSGTHKKDPLSLAIMDLKYRSKDYAIPIGYAIVLVMRNDFPQLLKSNYITYVPMHPDKLGKNGYDHAEELAKVVSHETGIPMIHALEKTRNEGSKDKNRQQRISGVQGLYRPKESVVLNGTKVILIDDIITTGADAAECAKILKQGGAVVVNVVVAGRTVHES